MFVMKEALILENSELQSLVERLSLQYFHKPFRHQAYFNLRLRTTGGRYLLRSHNIEINKKYFDEYGEQEISGIIKHELCHYHLHLEGKGYQHRDRDFKELLNRVGAPRFCSPLAKAPSSRKVIYYTCQACRLLFKRKKRINTARYVCGKCGGKLKMTMDNKSEKTSIEIE
jgi:SprT-like protein